MTDISKTSMLETRDVILLATHVAEQMHEKGLRAMEASMVRGTLVITVKARR